MATKFVADANRQLVDECAEKRSEINKLTKEEKLLSEKLRVKLDKKANGVMRGYLYDVELQDGTQRFLDPKKLAKFLTEAQIAKCYSTTKFTKLHFTKHAEVEA